MPKSTITIEEKDGLVTFYVEHDPAPEGPDHTWALPARAAQMMMDSLRQDAESEGYHPTYRQTKNTVTGHTDIETRPDDGEQHEQ